MCIASNPFKVGRDKPKLVKLAQKVEKINRAESEKHLSNHNFDGSENNYSDSLNEFEGMEEFQKELDDRDDDGPFIKRRNITEPSEIHEPVNPIDLSQSNSDKECKLKSSAEKQDEDTNITGAKLSLSSDKNKSGNNSAHNFETPDKHQTIEESIHDESVAIEKTTIQSKFIASKDVNMTPSSGMFSDSKQKVKKYESGYKIKQAMKISADKPPIKRYDKSTVNTTALEHYNSYSAHRQHHNINPDIIGKS